MTMYSDIDRRSVIRGLGGLAVVGTLAGCSTEDSGSGGGDGGTGGDGGDGATGGDGGDGSGGSGDSGGDGGGGNAEVDEYLSDTSNYDSIQDMTGQSEVSVAVGAEGNGANFAFEPAAIRVDQGTTVVWEWTGQGGSHDVTHEDGEFESESSSEEGFTFEHTFDSAGTSLYVCTPHEVNGMKGAVVVE